MAGRQRRDNPPEHKRRKRPQISGTPLATAAVERLIAADGVTATDVRERGIVGQLFLPAGDGPLEYFETALGWLREQPRIRHDRVGVLGTSRGGELALITDEAAAARAAIPVERITGPVLLVSGLPGIPRRRCPHATRSAARLQLRWHRVWSGSSTRRCLAVHHPFPARKSLNSGFTAPRRPSGRRRRPRPAAGAWWGRSARAGSRAADSRRSGRSRGFRVAAALDPRRLGAAS
jgi:hypothetical protein